MVNDPNTLASLQAEWLGVEHMRDRMKLLLVSTFRSALTLI